MLIGKGTSINLVATVKDKNGEPWNLSGHILRWIATNYTDDTVLFSQVKTVFEGAESNQVTFTFTDEETDAFTPKKYKYYFELETAQGDEYRSRKTLLSVDEDQLSDLDRKIYLNDNIIIYTEDDVILNPEEPSLALSDPWNDSEVWNDLLTWNEA